MSPVPSPTAKRGLARRLLAFAQPYWPVMLASLTLILIISGLVNYLPILIKRMTDDALLNTALTQDERIRQLSRLSLIYCALALTGYLIRYLQGILTAWLGQRIIYDLRMALYRKVIHLHQAHFDRTPVGALLTRVTTDVDRLQGFVTDGVVGTVADVFMLLSIMGYMLWIHWRVALVLFAVLPLMFILLTLTNRRLRQANRAIRERQSKLNALLQEDLVGMTTIQLFNREQMAQREFCERNTNLREAYYREVHWFSLYFPVIEGGQALAFVLILGTGGFLLLNHSALITLGVLIAFLAYIRDFFRPLGSLSDKAGLFQMAMAAAERVFALLDTPVPIEDPTEPVESLHIAGPICFENVWFAYQDEQWVLKDLSFTVEPGQVVAVVGATGAGKSTIINLIGRFYDVQRGSVTINGHDIRSLRQTDLRQHLGYVFQDPFLFAGTVAENIHLHRPGLSHEAVVRAARTVNAHDFIMALPSGYDTVLHERGAGLSLGQKQLLAMARTLAQDPELLFVLDEATASVDTATEHLIQDALAKLVDNRTSIVIAHRLSTIRHADRILVLRHGELVDAGTHQELMERGGTYRQLYEMLQHKP